MQWKLNQQIVTCVHVRVSSLSVTVPVTFWSPRVLSIWLALVTSRSGRARRATSCAKRRLLSLRPWRKRLLLGWWLGGFCKVFGCTIVECSYPDRIHAHRNRCKIEMFFQIWQTPCCGHCGLQVLDTSSSYDSISCWINQGYKLVQRPNESDEELRTRHVKMAGALAALLLRLANQRVEKFRVSERVSVWKW